MDWNNGDVADFAHTAGFFLDPGTAQHGCLRVAAYFATEDAMQCPFPHYPAPQYPGVSRPDRQDPDAVPDIDTTVGCQRLRRKD